MKKEVGGGSPFCLCIDSGLYGLYIPILILSWIGFLLSLPRLPGNTSGESTQDIHMYNPGPPCLPGPPLVSIGCNFFFFFFLHMYGIGKYEMNDT